MPVPRCPGQDMRFWKPEDIYEMGCPYCGHEIEFWKDEPLRICRNCRREVRNPRMNLGCAKWCKFAADCLGTRADALAAASPLVDRLKAQLCLALPKDSPALAFAEEVHGFADTLLAAEEADPRIAKAAAILGAVSVNPETGARIADPGLPEDLLEQAGFETEIVDLIRHVVHRLTTGESGDSPEEQVAGDALTLALAFRPGAGGLPDPDTVLPRLRTDSAAALARHRLGRAGH